MISVTSLSSYSYCPRKLFLSNVLKIVEIPKAVLIKGKIKHEIFEAVNNSEEAIVRSITDKQTAGSLENRFGQEYAKILRKTIIMNRAGLKAADLKIMDVYKEITPLISLESAAKASSIYAFIAENNLFGDELWQNLVPKIKSEQRAESSTLGIRGIIDQIHVYPDHIVPFELKTGSMPADGVWPGHKLQLGAYILLLNEKAGEIKKGYVRYVDHGTDRPVVMNPFFREQITDTIEKTTCVLKSVEVPDYCSNKNKCASCPLKKQCYDEAFIRAKIRMLIDG